MFEKIKKKKFLKEHPLCVACMRYKKATHVHVFTNGEYESRCDNHPAKILE